MWVAATPSIPAWPIAIRYVPYQGLLYVPLSLLVGMCVEAVLRGLCSRPLPLLAAGMAGAYALAPAICSAGALPRSLDTYARFVGVPHILMTLGAVAAAGALLSGCRTACMAVAVWAVLYIASQDALGPQSSHLPTALHMVALGLLWRSVRRRTMLLPVLAGIVHATGYQFDWMPHLGLALGAAAWVLMQDSLPRRTRAAYAVVYLLPIAAVSIDAPSVASQGTWYGLPWVSATSYWWRAVRRWLVVSRGFAAVGAWGLVLAWRSQGLRRTVSHPLALVLFGAAGAAAVGSAPAHGLSWLASLGAATVLATAVAIDALGARTEETGQGRAALLLGCTCAVSAFLAFFSGVWRSQVPSRDMAALTARMKPGSRLYVWGGLHAMVFYPRARCLPGAPQIATWLIEGGGVPRAQAGGLPAVARLEGLDRRLSEAPPRYVITGASLVRLSELPRFGQVLRRRYREAHRGRTVTLFERRDGPAPSSGTAAEP
jgi:hypothetical protein